MIVLLALTPNALSNLLPLPLLPSSLFSADGRELGLRACLAFVDIRWLTLDRAGDQRGRRCTQEGDPEFLDLEVDGFALRIQGGGLDALEHNVPPAIGDGSVRRRHREERARNA